MFHSAIRRTVDIRGCDRSIRHSGVEPCAFDLESRYIGSDSPDIVVRDIAPIVRNTVKILVIEPDGRVVYFASRGLQSGAIGLVQDLEDTISQEVLALRCLAEVC